MKRYVTGPRNKQREASQIAIPITIVDQNRAEGGAVLRDISVHTVLEVAFPVPTKFPSPLLSPVTSKIKEGRRKRMLNTNSSTRVESPKYDAFDMPVYSQSPSHQVVFFSRQETYGAQLPSRRKRGQRWTSAFFL